MNAAMSKRPAAPRPLDLVEAFINTNDLETGSDELATPGALRGWLLERRLIRRSDSVTEPDRERAIRLREALRRAVLANNTDVEVDPRAVRELNRLARDAPMAVAFAGNGTAHLEPAVHGVGAGLSHILAIVLAAIMTGNWIRLKGCANDACRWAFYDASKNRSSRWCEMADCGNDAKGRAYRARHRSRAETN